MLLLVSLFIVHPALAFASSVRESTGIDHAAQRWRGKQMAKGWRRYVLIN
jgi:hypothetical protein